MAKPLSKRQVTEELITRKSAKDKFKLEDYCFKEQLDFINDPAPYATACCSRRAGKTEACVAHMLDEALTKEQATILYLTLSRSNGKKLIWTRLLEVNRKYGLGGIPNNSDLSLTFPTTKSVIYVSGAKDKASIERFRGLALSLAYIDEAQSFGPYLAELIDDVISKALYDWNGKLRLTGTPGPVPSGYFFDVCNNEEWSHHHWTMHQNVFLTKSQGYTADQLIAQDMKRKGVTIEDPSIQRECFGQWVTDFNSLLFRYEETLNHYTQMPTGIGQLQTVMAVDIGWHDSDAISIIGWTEDSPNAYLLEEIITEKQTITALVDQMKPIIAQYNPIRIVMDTGGLGKKIAEEIKQRFNIPVNAAQKTDKMAFCELMNDSLRTGRLLAKKDGRFAFDCQKVEKVIDLKTGKIKISDRYHSDITDSVAYGLREALNWLHEPTVTQPAPYTPEWYRAQAKALEQRALERHRSSKNEDWFDPTGTSN